MDEGAGAGSRCDLRGVIEFEFQSVDVGELMFPGVAAAFDCICMAAGERECTDDPRPKKGPHPNPSMA
jgi:hypothetical protein